MVYITGDIHGEVARVREMVAKCDITPDDIIVLLGDVGHELLWQHARRSVQKEEA